MERTGGCGRRRSARQLAAFAELPEVDEVEAAVELLDEEPLSLLPDDELSLDDDELVLGASEELLLLRLSVR